MTGPANLIAKAHCQLTFLTLWKTFLWNLCKAVSYGCLSIYHVFVVQFFSSLHINFTRFYKKKKEEFLCGFLLGNWKERLEYFEWLEIRKKSDLWEFESIGKMTSTKIIDFDEGIIPNNLINHLLWYKSIGSDKKIQESTWSIHSCYPK